MDHVCIIWVISVTPFSLASSWVQPMGHQQEVRGSREGEVEIFIPLTSCLYSHHMGCVPKPKVLA